MDNTAGAWNPETYLTFERERTLPSVDLAARIDVSDPGRIIDIGCGPGNSTAVLRRRWPKAAITGLDSSEEMVRKARDQHPDLGWIRADAGSWVPDGHYHVVFSNAALQWIPDQPAVIRKLLAALEPGGALAVQVPANDRSPLHRAVLSVADRLEWRERMAGCAAQITYHDAPFYYDLLSGLTPRIELWTTTYHHIMGSHERLIDWYSSTGMKTYLARIDDEEGKTAFKSQVLDVSRPGYPPLRDGKVLFPFRRLFFVAYAATGRLGPTSPQ